MLSRSTTPHAVRTAPACGSRWPRRASSTSSWPSISTSDPPSSSSSTRPRDAFPCSRRTRSSCRSRSVINEYLEERYPDPPLLPLDAADRARARLLIYRFDELLGDPYYDLYFDRPGGSSERLSAALGALDARLTATPYLAGREYSLADIAYLPWIFRAETRLQLDLSPYEAIGAWVERLLERPAVAAERDVVAALS